MACGSRRASCCAPTFRRRSRAGSQVRLSIRPEKLALGPAADGRVGVDGTIVESVYMGTVTHYVVEIAPGARMIAVAQNTEDASGGNRPARGLAGDALVATRARARPGLVATTGTTRGLARPGRV